MGGRRVITEKTVVHKGMTVTTGKDGKISVDIPGQPHVELTHEEYLRLSNLMDDVTEWTDDDD